MDALNAREKNRVIAAVNARKTPEEAGLKTEAELAYYKIIREDARQHFDRGGVWPIFDLWELD